jgi:hypothetical protein
LDSGLIGGGRKNNPDNSHNLHKSYLKWLAIYIGLGFVVSLVLPFPISFAVYIIIFLILNIIRTDLSLRKSGVKDGIRGLYRSISSEFRSSGMSESIYNDNPIKFSCMNCGKEHKERKCPGCGSTAVRAG